MSIWFLCKNVLDWHLWPLCRVLLLFKHLVYNCCIKLNKVLLLKKKKWISRPCIPFLYSVQHLMFLSAKATKAFTWHDRYFFMKLLLYVKYNMHKLFEKLHFWLNYRVFWKVIICGKENQRKKNRPSGPYCQWWNEQFM